jgi:hypothetical protein
MGREIRKVPPNWQHPKIEGWRGERGDLQPMHDRTFADAAREWKEGYAAWERGERDEYCTGDSRNREYWEWNGDPPDRAYYRTWSDEEATWFQVWETVTEGTPVTPPFATPEELVDYLVQHGDAWDQRRGNGGWEREAAEGFVRDGFALTLVVDTGTGRIHAPRDGPL